MAVKVVKIGGELNSDGLTGEIGGPRFIPVAARKIALVAVVVIGCQRSNRRRNGHFELIHLQVLGVLKIEEIPD